MVKFIEPKNEAYEFIGLVSEVNFEISPEFNTERYHMIITPVNKNWKNQHNWIPKNKHSTEHEVVNGTALAEFMHQLNSLGIESETVTKTMKNMIGKEFWFVKKRIGKMEQEVWFPERLEGGVYGEQ